VSEFAGEHQMAHITPLNSEDCEDASADIQRLASATGFTANSMLALQKTFEA